MLNFEEISPVALGKKITEFTIVRCIRLHKMKNLCKCFPRRKDICEWSLIQLGAHHKSYSRNMHYLTVKCTRKKNSVSNITAMISNRNQSKQRKKNSSSSSPFCTLFIHKFRFNGGKLFFNFITHFTMVHWSITKTLSISVSFSNNWMGFTCWPKRTFARRTKSELWSLVVCKCRVACVHWHNVCAKNFISLLAAYAEKKIGSPNNTHNYEKSFSMSASAVAIAIANKRATKCKHVLYLANTFSTNSVGCVGFFSLSC